MPPLASWIVTRSSENPSFTRSRLTGLRAPVGRRFSRWVWTMFFHVPVAEQFLNRKAVGALRLQVRGATWLQASAV